MIDEKAAAVKVEALNKANQQNLVRALGVERYLYEIYSHDEIVTAYNPEVGMMLVRYRDARSNARKNVIETIKRVAGMPERVEHSRLVRMFYAGGFSVLLEPTLPEVA